MKSHGPSITRVEIPAEYNGYPVTKIIYYAFSNCDYLQEVYIPDSVKNITLYAFAFCPELRKVRFPKDVECSFPPISFCYPKLPVEAVLAGLAEGFEFDSTFFENEWFLWEELLRTDVFERVIDYETFWDIGLMPLLNHFVNHNLVSHFKILENAGLTLTAEEVDDLIKYSTEKGKTEMTAYLLDFKNRKIGFSGGDNFEL